MTILSGTTLETTDTISLDFVPHSIAYDAAYELFYATRKDSMGTVMRFDHQGKTQEMFSLSSVLKGSPSNITSLHFAPNTGTLFLLIGEQGLVMEVSRPMLVLIAPPGFCSAVLIAALMN